MEKPKFTYITHKSTEFNVEFQDQIGIPVTSMDVNRPSAEDLPVTLPCSVSSNEKYQFVYSCALCETSLVYMDLQKLTDEHAHGPKHVTKKKFIICLNNQLFLNAASQTLIT